MERHGDFGYADQRSAAGPRPARCRSQVMSLIWSKQVSPQINAMCDAQLLACDAIKRFLRESDAGALSGMEDTQYLLNAVRRTDKKREPSHTLHEVSPDTHS